MKQKTPKPKLAVWKFTSCDGCQLTLLNCEDELLDLLGTVDLAYFPEATSKRTKGPYDLSLVEGSITTADEAERIREVRANSKFLVTMGGCASAGGLQALRNNIDVTDYASIVYPSPHHIETLEQSTPVSAHVAVDFELRGCPVSQEALLEAIKAILFEGRKPEVPNKSVCVDCKKAGLECVMTAKGKPCLGPLTQAGCGALCPSYNRSCAGCYGPKSNANPGGVARLWRQLGVGEPEIMRAFRFLNSYAEHSNKEKERIPSEQ